MHALPAVPAHAHKMIVTACLELSHPAAASVSLAAYPLLPACPDHAQPNRHCGRLRMCDLLRHRNAKSGQGYACGQGVKDAPHEARCTPQQLLMQHQRSRMSIPLPKNCPDHQRKRA
eukprot:13134387-Alexandrium_andersonii.AAC.3